MAKIALHDPDDLMKELGSKGVVVKDKEETILEIAQNNNKENVEVLNLIF